MSLGFGAGLACGIGVGIAVGIAAGRKKVREEFERNLMDFSERHHVGIQSREGQPISYNDFVEEVLRQEERGNRRALLAVGVIAGVAVLLSIVWLILALQE